ncbi:HAD-IA family hydrolase [Fructilactobacillus ixorae]|uniref:HAD-IA family hydrolase n=1 Tax=Fructilactobacillus ixorae TaxID=1750535 RepID=A0ABY5C5C4_9LACO|nr:HAD-IA family hydrolase [Fructilactobacillus ixorae]USS92778.1 HAD-IA family hydrolase [Fructilactobacillus ixorae]
MINLLWDFDGTLFDTYPYMVSAFTKALQRVGIDEFEIDGDEIYRQMRGHSLNSAITKFSARFHVDPQQLQTAYREFEALEIQLAQPFAGAPAALQAVVKHGGQNGLVTHRDQAAVTLLAQANLTSLLTGVVTREQGFPRKPDPTALQFLLDQMQLDPAQTAFVGDRKLDVDAANRAGIKSILFDPDYVIEIPGTPSVTIHDLTELLPLIQ